MSKVVTGAPSDTIHWQKIKGPTTVKVQERIEDLERKLAASEAEVSRLRAALEALRVAATFATKDGCRYGWTDTKSCSPQCELCFLAEALAREPGKGDEK